MPKSRPKLKATPSDPFANATDAQIRDALIRSGRRILGAKRPPRLTLEQGKELLKRDRKRKKGRRKSND